MAVKRLGAKNEKIEAGLKEILERKMDGNPDGFFLARPAQGLRTMDKKQAKEFLATLELDSFLSHFRIGTEGKKNVHNVQGWHKKGWMFIHNGSAGGYYEKGKMALEYTDSDSLSLFNEMLERLEKINTNKDKHVRQVIQDSVDTLTSFWGRAMLYHNDTDRLFLFGDWHIYKLADSYIAMSSVALDFNEPDSKQSLNGLEFKYKSASSIGEGKYDGIGVIRKFQGKDWQFKHLSEFKKPSYRYQPKKVGYRTDTDEDDVPKPPIPSVFYNASKADDTIVNGQKTILLPDKTHRIEVDKPKMQKFDLTRTKLQGIGDDDYDELFADRMDRVIGKNAEGFEVYMDETGIHDIFNFCCNYRPKKCIAVELGYTFHADADKKVYGDGTEIPINSKLPIGGRKVG